MYIYSLYFFMETSPTIHSLIESSDGASEEMVFLPMEIIQSKWVTPGGRLIRPSKYKFPGDLPEVCVIQHGLPGDSWRTQMEEKARQAIQDGLEAAFYFLIPGGTRGSYNLGKNMGLDEIDWQGVHESKHFFFDQPFSFTRYARQLYAAAAGLRKYVPSECKVHLAGHSYGALGLLYALGQSARDGSGRSQLASANFLSPFVQVALDMNDPDVALNVINTRVAVEGVQRVANTANQIGALRDVLAELHRLYHLTEPVRNPIEWHRDAFGKQFFEAVGDLRPVVRGGCDVRVFRGERDSYIDERHGDLIAKLTGLTRSSIEKVFPDDGHNIASLDVKELVK